MVDTTLSACWKSFVQFLETKLGTNTVERWVVSFDVSIYDSPKAHERKIVLRPKDSFQTLWFEEHLKAYLPYLKDPVGNVIPVFLDTKLPKKQKNLSTPSSPNGKLNGLFFPELDPLHSFDKFISTDENLIVIRLLQEMCSYWISKQLTTVSPVITSSTAPTTIIPPNPIYICGPTGSGKTHLISACTQRLKQVGLSTITASAELFTDHVVKSMRSGEMSSFRTLWRKADILFIEDVQTLSRKNATQEEFFHTFNTLHMAGKQVVLTANCFPQQLQYIEPRLVSRFEWGIVLPLTPLPKKLYPNLLEKKSLLYNFPLSSKLSTFLAESFSSSPKALSEALKTLIFRLKSAKPHSLSQVQDLLSDLIEKESSTALSPQKIITLTAQSFGLTSDDLTGKSQSRECSVPRQIAMFLMRKHLKTPYMKIADVFHKNHSTVISAIRQVEKNISDTSSNIGSAIASIEISLYDIQSGTA